MYVGRFPNFVTGFRKLPPFRVFIEHRACVVLSAAILVGEAMLFHRRLCRASGGASVMIPA